MSNDALDLAFARHVRQIGLVTPEQVAAALQTQGKSLQAGTPLTFADALVQLGTISAAQREALQKKVKDQQAGIQQLGPYRLLKKLGEGGMGAVYLAEEPEAARRVAVKVLPRHLGANAEFVKRFQREAQAAIRLKHPHIVGAFAAGEDLGFHYYVMEYCEGEALDALIKRERSLPVARAIDLVLQAARGLGFAHAQGILHRDIKPSNIMLARDGSAKILDLGLSKRMDDASVSFKTVTGAVLGTPHYISPEQAQGEKGIDGRSDLYSLGATFYHLLTGQTPFEGTTILEVLHKQVHTALPNPQDLREDIPDAVVRVLERMMAKKPADRYADAAALIADLEEVQAGRTPKTQMLDPDRTTIAPPLRRAAPRKRPSTVRRVATSRKSPALLVGGIVAGLAVVVLAVALSGGRPEPPREDAAVAPRKSPPPPPPSTSSAPSTEEGFLEAVAKLPAEERLRAVVAKLKEINPGFDGPVAPVLEGGVVTGLSIAHPRLVRAWPLRALKELTSLRIEGGGLEDLAPLRGLRLSTLHLSATRIADLGPLKGMPLRELAVDRTAVQDLRPLEGMPLRILNADGTGVAELAPLKGLPLESLGVARTRVRDLSPLAGMRLRSLRCDLVLERDLAVLRSMPGLETLNDVPAASLIRKAEAPPALAPEAAWAEAVDLMPFIAAEDATSGRWVREGAELRSEPGLALQVLALPYAPPDEYDFRIVFTPRGEVPDVNQIVVRGGRAAQWLLGAYDNTLFGFGYEPGLDPRAHPQNLKKQRCLEPGRRYVSIVQVRKDGLAGFLDGHLLCRRSADLDRLELGTALVYPDRSRLGLVTYGNPAQFHAVEVREIGGKGRLLRSTPPPPPLSPAEAGLQAALAKLKELNPGFDGASKHVVKDGIVTELSLSALGVADLSPLAALKGLRVLDVSGRWDAAAGQERRSPLKDLSPLRGLPLVDLTAHHAEVEDLSPLRGMKLEALDVTGTRVADLGPLRGMPLRRLSLGFTKASSLAPLAGAPLELLDLRGSAVADLGPVKSFPLRTLRAALDPKRDVKWLAGMATLEQINEMSAAEFLRLGGLALADPWKDAVDLLPLIDPARDVLRGTWKSEGGRLMSEPSGNGVLRIPYEPPAEYDFRIVFTRTNGGCATAQFLTHGGKPFVLDLGGWGNTASGFSDVAGVPGNQNPTKSALALQDGRRYVCVVQVRKGRVTALLDDRKVAEWIPSMGELSGPQGEWNIGSPTMIGLGNCEALTVFETLQVRELGGKGRARTATSTPPDPAFLRAVSALPAAEQLRRVLAKLAELNPGFEPSRAAHKLEGGRIAELAVFAPRLLDLWPLRGLPALRRLDLGDPREKGLLSDLAALKGLPLRELGLANTRVADLAPLQGMPLVQLRLQGTLVKDLAPLKGMKLVHLSLAGAPAADLAPLRGMPLKSIDLRDSGVVDLAPLGEFKSLETINEQPAREALKGGGAPWRPLFDGRSADCLRDTESWRFEDGALVNVPGARDAAQTRHEFGDGELRIRFEPLGLDGLFFKARQSAEGGYSLFFDKALLKSLEGRVHEAVFTCRGDQVTATLDGRPMPLGEVKRTRSGCLQFMVQGKSLRITAIDVRD